MSSDAIAKLNPLNIPMKTSILQIIDQKTRNRISPINKGVLHEILEMLLINRLSFIHSN